MNLVFSCFRTHLLVSPENVPTLPQTKSSKFAAVRHCIMCPVFLKFFGSFGPAILLLTLYGYTYLSFTALHNSLIKLFEAAALISMVHCFF